MKKMKVFFFALVTLMVLGLTGCGGTSIDLMDYVTVTFSGVDGQGTAVCNVDMAKLEQDLAGDKDGEISQEELEQLAWIAQFELTVSYQLDKETGLSNGDQVTVSATCDEDFAKDNKVKVSEGKKEFKVEGLKDPVEVDAFASDIFDTDTGVTLEYYGTSPSANLTITSTITKPLAVLGENGKGYTKEANFISWNGNAAKLDIREWHPNHERCGKGITLTEDEGRNLYAALKTIYEKE